MRSDDVKAGYQRAPNRSLLRSLGVTDREMDLPFIGIANAYNTIVPGHIHLRQLSEKVHEGIAAGGGVPFEFGVIGICDGIAMGHEGMRYSLPSRENIADSVELMAQAHRFDGLVCIGTCDKIVPGMLMAAARCNIPTIVLTGGPMLSGTRRGKTCHLSISSKESVRSRQERWTKPRCANWSAVLCRVAGVPGALYSQYDGMHDGGDGDVTPRVCSNTGSRCSQAPDRTRDRRGDPSLSPE